MRARSIWLLVVGTACTATVAFVLTACWLFLRGDTDAGKEAAQLGSGTLAATLALLARQPETPPETPVPVQIDQPQGEPVPVEEVPAEEPRARRGRPLARPD